MTSKPSIWNRWITKDRGIFFLCIGIASIFWFFVKLSATYETKLRLNVTFALPPGMVFKKAPTTSALVKVQGSGWDLLFFGFSRKEIFITVKDKVDELQEKFILQNIQSQIPKLNVMELIQDNWKTIEIATNKLKKVPIIAQYKLELPQGKILDREVQLVPAFAFVSGPSTTLDTLLYLKTKIFTISKSADIGHVMFVDLDLPITLQSIEKQTLVSYSTDILIAQKVLVPVRAYPFDPRDSVVFLPSMVEIQYSVGMKNISKIHPDQFVIGIKNKHGDASKKTAVKVVEIPSFVKDVKITPDSVLFFSVY